MLELLRVPNEELLLGKLFYPNADSTRSIAGDAAGLCVQKNPKIPGGCGQQGMGMAFIGDGELALPSFIQR